jgi:hypothetical protein
VQEGVVLKFHGDTSHGYRYIFHKHADTQAYLGSTLQGSAYSVLDVRLDIVPIANGLRDAAKQIPLDLPEGPQRAVLSAVAFRGLLTANDRLEFRPNAAITRREFACALARSTHLNAPLPPVPTIDDVDLQSLEGDEIVRVVGAGLMSLELPAKFSPDKNLTPADAVTGLEKLARLSRSQPDAEVLAAIRAVANSGAKPPSRAEIGHLLHRILDLPQ